MLDLAVSLDNTDDATVLAAVRLVRDGVEVPFEGSYGFDRDVVTHGWLRVSHRALDQERSLDWLPVHAHARGARRAGRARQPVDPPPAAGNPPPSW